MTKSLFPLHQYGMKPTLSKNANRLRYLTFSPQG
jgi:hypothetical protein